MSLLQHFFGFTLRPWRAAGLLLLILLIAGPVVAQTQRGDKPQNNRAKLRDARFKSRNKQGDRPVTRDPAGRRVRTKNKSSADRAAASYPSPKKRRSPRGDVDASRVGRPIGATVGGSRPRDNQRAYTGPGGRVKARSATGRVSNVFRQFGKFGRIQPRDTEHPVSNRRELARLKRGQSNPMDAGGRKVKARSASRSYISHRSVNPMARFSRGRRHQGDRPVTNDLTGRPLRKKNFESPRPPLIPQGNPYAGRKRVGDRPYSGRASVFSTSPQVGQRAWKGDLTGRKIRGRNYQSKVQTGGSRVVSGRPPKPKHGDRQRHVGRFGGGGGRSATQPPEKRTGRSPIPPRAPGIGSQGIDYRGRQKLFESKPGMSPQGAGYSGNIKARRPAKGGGSVSGRHWNNKQTPIPARTPGAGSRGINYRGNIRLHESRPMMTPQGADYTGHIKARRPLKGGGSVSGKLWNNKERPVAVKPPGIGSQGIDYRGKQRLFEAKPSMGMQGADYTGNIKAKRPKKGGGSVSGKLWNNKETPIAVRPPTGDTQRAAVFQGNIKSRRQEKGGGSVSGKLWNNKETPIPVKPPSEETRRASSFPGNQMLFDANPAMVDQGEEFTGTIRQKRFGRSYVKNPNQAEGAIKKKRPHESTYQVDNIYGRVKQYNYVRNPSSAEDALRVREPGKAFGKATDYQGNIKMKKFELFEKNKRNLHPDAQFVKLNKNNVDDERGLLTNLKLWWARNFKKNDNLPGNVKEKEHKPRYDKREEGLWYD